MGKHFFDRLIISPLLAILTAAGVLSLAFGGGGDNQERKQQGHNAQVTV